MRVRPRFAGMQVFYKYEVLGRGVVLYLGGGVILHYLLDACSRVQPFSVFTSTSPEFAEEVMNEVMGMVAVPLDEAYLAETVGGAAPAEFVGLYRFVALPLDYALGLAGGEPMPVDTPELERAAELMAHRGIAAIERGRMRLASDEVRRAILRQAERIVEAEGRIMERALGGGIRG